jgi:hypothetical protein
VGVALGLCTGNETNANYLLVREGAENDLLVRQCTFVHAAAYRHTRDATQRCQFGEFIYLVSSFLLIDVLDTCPSDTPHFRVIAGLH